MSLPPTTYHLTPPDGPILTAWCGKELGNGDGHAGVYPATLVEIAKRSLEACDLCHARAVQMLVEART